MFLFDLCFITNNNKIDLLIAPVRNKHFNKASFDINSEVSWNEILLWGAAMEIPGVKSCNITIGKSCFF